MVLIGLIGQKQTGKDTFADYLVKTRGFKKLAFAEPVKQVCQILFHLEPEQVYDPRLKEVVDERWGLSPRQMMQKVGTDMVRNMLGNDFWVKHMDISYSKGSIVISDVRFKNEAEWVKDRGGVLIRIVDGSHHCDHHPSETEQLSIKEDVVLKNDKNGLEEFHQQIETTIKNIL
jgi:hypothetical protein